MNFEIAPVETVIRANWDDAKLYCFSLNIDGKTGWRLPSIFELHEIYDSPNDFEELYYWSSTECNYTEVLYKQFFGGGYSYSDPKSIRNFVRAVRTIR